MKISILPNYNTSFFQYYERTKGASPSDLQSNGLELINDAFHVMQKEFEILGYETSLHILSLSTKEDLIQRIIEESPDVIFIGSYFGYYGDFLKEIKENIKEAINLQIEGMLEDGEDIPISLQGEYNLELKLDVAQVFNLYKSINSILNNCAMLELSSPGQQLLEAEQLNVHLVLIHQSISLLPPHWYLVILQ